MMIRLYWMGGDRNEINFGDTLSPHLVELLSGRKVVYAPVPSCDLAAVGSLLDKIFVKKRKRPLFLRFDKLRVWGTGSLGPEGISARHGLSVMAVRGKKTAQSLGVGEDVPLGDPGLLIDRFETRAAKKYRWGIIPHVVDARAPVVREMHKRNTDSLLIDLGDSDIVETIRRIQSCHFVISSSLHGLITADAFGIPNVWMRVSENVAGGNWKFNDYFTGVGRSETSPLQLPGAAPDLHALEETAAMAEKALVEARKEGLERSFKSVYG